MKSKSEQFARKVVEQLQSAGFRALWAGGCVRDRLLGREPKDYDVATNATPPEIRRVFRRHRTLSIGAAFGVVAVLGSEGEGAVEVATFRCDSVYSDGRHPDGVTFSTPEEDAKRRDFTINGMFFDPLQDRVIDYVGGQQDLQAKLIRAIGDPLARFGEDKLRMLRAVRFSAHFQFALEEQTKLAILAFHETISMVSAERIAEELRQMLTHPSRVTSVNLLRETGLLTAVLPEAAWFDTPAGDRAWAETIRVLGTLGATRFPVPLAALLRGLPCSDSSPESTVRPICRRWRLANWETNLVIWLLTHEATVRSASQVPWSTLQPILVNDAAEDMMQFATAVAEVVDPSLESIGLCRRRLELPREQLDPPPLVTGDDLVDHGLSPGRQFKTLLSAVRNAQLDQEITSKEDALALVDRLGRPNDATRE